ncbi:MAG: exodeoxyribonuclease III [Thermoleophilaceae bacterium]
MRVVSWNVNSLKVRLPRVLELLEQYRPDVLLMQETKCAADAFPLLELEAAGYQAAHHSAGRWAGVAVATPVATPIEDVCFGLAGEPAVDEARWVEADVAGVRVASVYVPNGREVGSPPFLDKLRFFEAVAERVRRHDGPLLVAGDFNVCPADVDVYEPAAFAGQTHVTPEERERHAAILDAGLVDAFRHLHPDEVAYTWWDYRQGHFHRGLGLRIDAILVTPGLADRLERCGIDRAYRKGAKPSDHAPLFAQLSGDGPLTGPPVPDAGDSKQT